MFDGFVVHSHRTSLTLGACRDGFDCGFLVPVSLNPLVRDVKHGRYWSGLLLPGIIIFSVHFMHRPVGDQDSFIDSIKYETQEFFHACSAKYAGREITIIAGIDANVTLPPGIEGTTGTSTLSPLPSHTVVMQHSVLSWLQQFDLRALNTYIEGVSPSLLWTCGWKRSRERRSQIDYICGTRQLQGVAHPMNECTLRDNKHLRQGADHRPIMADLQLQYAVDQCCPRPLPRPTLFGWQPAGEEADREFRNKAADGHILDAPLSELETRLKEIATQVPHRLGPDKAVLDQRLDELAAVQNSRETFKLKRAAERKRAMVRRQGKLSLLNARTMQTVYMTKMEINGQLTCDRSLWLDGALRFGTDRFCDPANTMEAQRSRLAELISAAVSNRIDGRPGCKMEYWDFLQARAKIRKTTAAGPDGVPPEVYIRLPSVTLMHIYNLFRKRMLFEDGQDSSPYWKILEFVGIPKCKMPRTFGDLRWICKSSVLQKWFMRSLRPALREQVQPSRVHAFGFKPKSSSVMVTSLVRQILHLAHSWDLPCVISCQDVRTAFDSMTHGSIRTSLCARGVGPDMTGIMMRELLA